MARTGAGTRRGRTKSTHAQAEPVSGAATASTESGAQPSGDDVTQPHDTAPQAPDAAPLTGKTTDSSFAELQPTDPETGTGTSGDTASTPAPAEDEPAPATTDPHTADPGSGQEAGVARPSTPAPPPPPRRGGAFGMILGGVVAAAIGAGATLYLLPQGLQREGTQVLEERLSALEARDTQPELSRQDLNSAISPLLERLDALDTTAAPPDLTAIEARLAALESNRGQGAETLANALAPLQDRLSRLEERIDTQIEATVSQALATAQARQQAQVEALEDAQSRLEAAQTRLEARAALAELIAAAETGLPAASALNLLAAATDIPPALDAFHDGLPTLGMLQQGFPAAARAALAAAPVAEESSPTDRLIGFLRNQTGARSLAPREGDDTDAILSRAEAQLRAADLAGAVSEIDSLPADPAAAMAAWRAQAEARLAAIEALGVVQAQLGSD